ncbi:MAG: AarF/ABC1/UbiB kinase family protein [Coriobacteriia bacterium]|nr:AarF/ABC1/UbiB kinase family protein [Coriobacteriia bacterium]
MAARERHVAAVLARNLMAAAVEARFGFRGRVAWREAVARRLRVSFQELGPAWIKLGQLISVRPDVFSAEWVFEMELLRDSVKPMPAAAIREVIQGEFGRDPDSLFSAFDDVPLASASIAQVHCATLREEYRPVVGAVLPAGTRLAIKVVRPGVRAAVLADIESARSLVARIATFAGARRLNLPSLLEEFAESLHSECDLRNEGRSADRFAHDFADDPLVVVPRVVWPMTTRRVLAMEFIEGWRLSELGEAERAGIDGLALAEHGAEVFMRGVLVHGRFHGDLHPANVFVTPDGRICYLDFGIVGTTRADQRESIAQVLAATVYGDAQRALEHSARLGLVVPVEQRLEVTRLVGALMGDTLGTAPRDVRGFAIGFLEIMRRNGVAVPVGFGLLIKALVTVEGVSRALYPGIDIVETAKPFATGLIAKQMMSPVRISQRMPAAIRAALRELAGA